MSPYSQAVCLREIERLWLSCPDENRPAATWIVEHLPIPAKSDHPQTPITAAWFLETDGLSKRPPESYVRFITAHSGQYWYKGMNAAPKSKVFGRVHDIGLAAFAPIQDSDLIYIHFIWGGLRGCGSHYRFNTTSGTLDCVRNLWIS